MTKSSRIKTVAVTSIAAASMIAASAFADSRPSQETWRGGRDNRDQGSYSQRDRGNTYRDHERVTVQGRVQSFSHERGGYRVHLDRGPSFWIPENRMRRGLDIRVGIDIVLGGVFRDDSVYVDDVNYPGSGYDDYGYQNGSVRGVVERVDYRYGSLLLREERTGRTINVDMRGTARRSRIDLNDLRRGDRVVLNGDWSRGGVFRAYEIDSVRTGRW